jgi:glycosyltransferase involved in cell wall biosynthesis
VVWEPGPLLQDRQLGMATASSGPAVVAERPPDVCRTQEEIKAMWDNDAPLVSICCAAFNHGRFIKDALNGFLMQETEFPFEIVIHDDASTDDTASVIREFESRYPEIITAIVQHKNQYSKGVRPFPVLYAKSRGKYIAYCEGDDYWSDPCKLARQVEFLELNPEYVISGHNAMCIDDKYRIIRESKLPDLHQCEHSSIDLISSRRWILTLSWVFRKVPMEFPQELAMIENADRMYLSLLGNYGKSWYHSDITPACYRVHQGGVWSTRSQKEQKDANINTLFWMYRYYSRTNQKQYANECWKTYMWYVMSVFGNRCIIRWMIEQSIKRIHCQCNQLVCRVLSLSQKSR